MAPAMKRVRDMKMTPDAACGARMLSDAEYARLGEIRVLVNQVVAVNDFTQQELRRYFPAAGPKKRSKRREAVE